MAGCNKLPPVQGRGEIFQGGGDLPPQLEVMRARVLQNARKLKSQPGRYPLCRYLGCASGMDARACAAVETFLSSESDRLDCEHLVTEALDEWISLNEGATPVALRVSETALDADGEAVVARTESGPSGAIYFQQSWLREKLKSDPSAVLRVLVHELTHKATVDGTHPKDESGGRARIDRAAAAFVYLAEMSRDEEAFLFDQEMGLKLYATIDDNWGGEGEKWLKDRESLWFFIRPSGEVYRWAEGTQPLTGELAATLTPLYFEHPELLVNAVLPVWAEGEAQIQAKLAKRLDMKFRFIQRDADYRVGSGGLNEKWLRAVAAENLWFYLLPDGKLIRWSGQAMEGTLFTTLPVSYYENPRLLHEASGD